MPITYFVYIYYTLLLRKIINGIVYSVIRCPTQPNVIRVSSDQSCQLILYFKLTLLWDDLREIKNPILGDDELFV